jgi:feruloyl esterase
MSKSAKTWRLLYLSLGLVGYSSPSVAKAEDPALARPAIQVSNLSKCNEIRKADFSGIKEAPTQIISTEYSERSGDKIAHCVVEGYVTPQVGFKIFLPDFGWNGKFIQIGSGGHGGVIFDSGCAAALQRGYACLVSDLGHKGMGLDTEWARGNLQARMDWGFRATHVATVAAKAIIQYYYGRLPSHSYFSGCSTGGRQALQEAQKFPWDYDGIIAGAPPIRLSDLYVTFAWGALANRDASGRMLLDRRDLDLLTKAALAKCDMDDGLRDGLIAQPQQCSFRPSELVCSEQRTSQCLTPAQIAAAEKIYSGPLDEEGKSLYGGGALPGSERQWERYYLDNISGELPYFFNLTGGGFRMLFSDPQLPVDWKLKSFDFEKDFKMLDVMQSIYDSSNPDLTRFMNAGGKLIMFIGLNDVSMPNAVIDYYRKVGKISGSKTNSFARLFLLPGVDHCGGGPGAGSVDYLTYLEDWVERQVPPSRLFAVHPGVGSRTGTGESVANGFSRPVFPYPTYPKYDGKGDPSKSESFVPAEMP